MRASVLWFLLLLLVSYQIALAGLAVPLGLYLLLSLVSSPCSGGFFASEVLLYCLPCQSVLFLTCACSCISHSISSCISFV